MEHLLLATGGTLTEEDWVPYVASNDYKGVPFAEYLEKTGKRNVWSNPYEGTSKEQACLWQTWLCFCLLQDFLGPDFVHDDYITSRIKADGSEGLFFTTDRLGVALERWVERNRAEPLEQVYERHHGNLNVTGTAFSKRKDLRVFSISALSVVAVLQDKLTFVSGLERYEGIPNALRYLHDTDIRIMKAQGWCPYEIARHWSDTCSIQVQMLLRTSIKTPPVSHQNCSIEKCVNIVIDPEIYQVTHLVENCQCSTFQVDPAKVRQFMEAGNTPLIVAHLADGEPTFSIDIAPSDPQISYVAISHVWADGLGNPRANALPMCRIQDLAHKVANVLHRYDSIQKDQKFFLWLDTLCCPINPPNLKQLAISRMRNTYQSAKYTLVLDSHLQTLNFGSMPVVEAGLQIANSRWMLRLWTLQEAGLAQRLVFRFKDQEIEAIALRSLLSEAYLEPGRSVNMVFDCESKILRLVTYFSTEKLAMSTNIYLANFVEAIQGRGLSVPEDEPVCLMTLLGGDTSLFVGSREDNMVQFWTTCAQQGFIRPSFILNSLPKISRKGFRWAPLSLLYDNHKIPLYGREYVLGHAGMPRCSLSPDGLVLQAPGHILSGPSAPQSLAVLESLRINRWYRVMLYSLQRKQWFMLQFDKPQQWGSEKLSSLSNQLGLIVDPWPDPVFNMCMLVQVNERAPDSIRTTMLGRGSLYRHTTEQSLELSRVVNNGETSIESKVNSIAIKEVLRLHGWRDNSSPRDVIEYFEGLVADLRQGLYISVNEDVPNTQSWTAD